jgi:hypothetical protein
MIYQFILSPGESLALMSALSAAASLGLIYGMWVSK